jgi:hypothetical protein
MIIFHAAAIIFMLFMPPLRHTLSLSFRFHFFDFDYFIFIAIISLRCHAISIIFHAIISPLMMPPYARCFRHAAIFAFAIFSLPFSPAMPPLRHAIIISCHFIDFATLLFY